MGATTFGKISISMEKRPLDELVPEGKVDIHGDYGNYCYIGRVTA